MKQVDHWEGILAWKEAFTAQIDTAEIPSMPKPFTSSTFNLSAT